MLCYADPSSTDDITVVFKSDSDVCKLLFLPEFSKCKILTGLKYH